MTIARTGSEDIRRLMQFMPVHAGNRTTRDFASLDTSRLLSSAKPSRIRQPQTWPLGGISCSAIFIASTGLMMTPPCGIAGSDVDMLVNASVCWIGAVTQPTGTAYQTLPLTAAGDTSSPTVDRQLHERLLTAPIEVLSREALAALGITKTQMAFILGIERPHFYQWLKGGVENPSKAGRLRDLLKLLHRAGATPQDPLRAHLLGEPLEPGATPLLTQLAGNLKSTALASAMLQATRLNRTISDETEQRQARMRAAGHKAPDDDEAQTIFDTTMTMTEWDNA